MGISRFQRRLYFPFNALLKVRRLQKLVFRREYRYIILPTGNLTVFLIFFDNINKQLHNQTDK